MNDLIEKFKNLTNNWQQEAEKWKQEAINNIKNQASILLNKTLEVEKCIERAANETGQDVSMCFKAAVTNTTNLPQLAVDKAIECINNEINSAVSIIKNINSTIVEIWDDITKNFKPMVDKCIADPSLSCLWDIPSKAIDYTKKITSILADITAFGSGLKARIIFCGSTKLLEVQGTAASIVTDLVKCITNKVSNFKHNCTLPFPYYEYHDYNNNYYYKL